MTWSFHCFCVCCNNGLKCCEHTLAGSPHCLSCAVTMPSCGSMHQAPRHCKRAMTPTMSMPTGTRSWFTQDMVKDSVVAVLNTGSILVCHCPCFRTRCALVQLYAVVYTVVLMEVVRDVSYLFARSFRLGEITTVQLMAVGDAVKAWVVPRVLNQPLTFV